MIEAIIFDFDGVIVNSNTIKKNAFFYIFSHIKNSRKPVEEALRENPKKTRYRIVEGILKKLREKSLIDFSDLEAERNRYVSMYGETTEKETIKAEEIRGAKQALKNLSQKYPLFVLTSTIQESIDRVIKGRKLEKYFKGIYGANSSDYNKPQILERISREHSFNPKKSVFVGDGKADYECAEHHNMQFIAILNDTNDFKTREDIRYKLYDLEKLPEIVEEIEKRL